MAIGLVIVSSKTGSTTVKYDEKFDVRFTITNRSTLGEDSKISSTPITVRPMITIACIDTKKTWIEGLERKESGTMDADGAVDILYQENSIPTTGPDGKPLVPEDIIGDQSVYVQVKYQVPAYIDPNKPWLPIPEESGGAKTFERVFRVEAAVPPPVKKIFNPTIEIGEPKIGVPAPVGVA